MEWVLSLLTSLYKSWFANQEDMDSKVLYVNYVPYLMGLSAKSILNLNWSGQKCINYFMKTTQKFKFHGHHLEWNNLKYDATCFVFVDIPLTLNPVRALIAPPKEWPTNRRRYPSHFPPRPSNSESNPCRVPPTGTSSPVQIHTLLHIG